MKAIIFKKPGEYAYEDRPVPQVEKPDDVQIKVLGVGICGTDLHVLMDPPMHPAKPGIIFGHEYCGEVAAVGEAVDWLKPGTELLLIRTRHADAVKIAGATVRASVLRYTASRIRRGRSMELRGGFLRTVH